MKLELVLAQERPVACATNVRFFTRVGEKVYLELGLVRKRLVACVTNVGLLSCVDKDMTLKGEECGECFAAHIAFVRKFLF